MQPYINTIEVIIKESLVESVLKSYIPILITRCWAESPLLQVWDG